MVSQKLDCRSRILNGFGFINFLIVTNSLVPVVAFVSELYAALDAPKQIRTDGYKAMRGIPVSHAANVVVDSVDLLKHDDAWSITTRGQGKVGVELTAIQGLNHDHPCNPWLTVLAHPFFTRSANAQETAHAAMGRGPDRKVCRIGRVNSALHRFVNCLLTTSRFEQLVSQMDFDVWIEKVE